MVITAALRGRAGAVVRLGDDSGGGGGGRRGMHENRRAVNCTPRWGDSAKPLAAGRVGWGGCGRWRRTGDAQAAEAGAAAGSGEGRGGGLTHRASRKSVLDRHAPRSAAVGLAGEPAPARPHRRARRSAARQAPPAGCPSASRECGPPRCGTRTGTSRPGSSGAPGRRPWRTPRSPPPPRVRQRHPWDAAGQLPGAPVRPPPLPCFRRPPPHAAGQLPGAPGQALQGRRPPGPKRPQGRRGARAAVMRRQR